MTDEDPHEGVRRLIEEALERFSWTALSKAQWTPNVDPIADLKKMQEVLWSDLGKTRSTYEIRTIRITDECVGGKVESRWVTMEEGLKPHLELWINPEDWESMLFLEEDGQFKVEILRASRGASFYGVPIIHGRLREPSE